MKERPILFSTPMVKAVLACMKDITRRAKGLEVINLNPDDWEFNWFDYQAGWCFNQKSTINDQTLADRSFNQEVVKCPYGLVGDILWVRESIWQVADVAFTYPDDDEGTVVYYNIFHYKTDGTPKVHGINKWNREPGWTKEKGFIPYFGSQFWKARPSIHMPKEACRLKLEVLSIRPERLHDITEEECFREGIDADNEDYQAAEHYQLGGSPIQGGSPAKFAFIALWQRINGQESWDSNPWVWRIEFKKLLTND